MRLPRTALAPSVALGCLALFLFLSLLSANLASTGDTMEGRDRRTSTRYAEAITVFNVDPGDQVLLTFGTSSSMEAAIPYTRILAVEGGEGEALLNGGPPQHILFETRFELLEPGEFGYREGRYGPINTRFTRPDIYEGKPHGQALNGDTYNAVDIVILVDRPAGMSQTTWDQVAAAGSEISRNHDIVVGREPWNTIQWVWYVGMAASFAAAVVGFVGLIRHRPSVSENQSDLAGLMAIQGRAIEFLRTLKLTMAAAGTLLAFGGLTMLVALNTLQFGRFTPFGSWPMLVMALGFTTYVLAMAVWTVQYRRISREYKRWTTTPNPLDA